MTRPARSFHAAVVLVLAATGSSHALKPKAHADITKASCAAAGLGDDTCSRIATEDYDTDSREWGDVAAHAQIDDAQTACAAADRAVQREWELGHDLRGALANLARTSDEEWAGTADALAGRALHTLQDNCAHHGMPNPQHAWFSLGDFCEGTSTSPDVRADAIACARVETDSAMVEIAAAVTSAGVADLLDRTSCPDNGDASPLPVCDARYLPDAIEACDFLGRAKDWDGIDRTWDNAVVLPALRGAFAGGLRGETAPGSICGGDESALSRAASDPIVDVSKDAPGCAKSAVLCLGKADDSDNPFADDPAAGTGGCGIAGDRRGSALLGFVAVAWTIRRRSRTATQPN